MDEVELHLFPDVTHPGHKQGPIVSGKGITSMPRPKGSRNKAKSEFDVKFERAQRAENFELVAWMMGIASGNDCTEDWTRENRIDCAKFLANKRYPTRREQGPQELHGIPEQIKIVYDDTERGKPVLTPVPTVGTEG